MYKCGEFLHNWQASTTKKDIVNQSDLLLNNGSKGCQDVKNIFTLYFFGEIFFDNQMSISMKTDVVIAGRLTKNTVL